MKNQFEFAMKISVLEVRNDCTLHVVDRIVLDKSDIRYRAEGNANIVISLPALRKVLRLPKYDRIASLNDNNGSNSKQQSYPLNRILFTYQYMKGMSKFFGSQLLEPSLILLEITNSNAFNEWLLQFRPADRCHRIVAPLSSDYGLLESDAAFVQIHPSSNSQFNSSNDIYSIEIKPKQGWPLDANTLKLLNIDECNVMKCRYCAMQYLKLKKNEIKTIGGYCPLDLFSGNIQRMKKAVYELLRTPQNNFRIFKNGNLIYAEQLPDKRSIAIKIFQEIFPDNCSVDVLYDKFITLIIRMLLFNGNTNNDSMDGVCVNTKDCNSSMELNQDSDDSSCQPYDDTYLPDKSILELLLSTQLLGKIYMPDIAGKCQSTTFPDTDDTLPVGRCQQHCLCHEGKCLKVNCDHANEKSYSIGATAMDCSIMITFFRHSNQHNEFNCSDRTQNITNIDKMKFNFKTSVIDLDPKPAYRHFIKYQSNTKASYQAHKEFIRN